jgi:hypothetical protein
MQRLIKRTKEKEKMGDKKPNKKGQDKKGKNKPAPKAETPRVVAEPAKGKAAAAGKKKK